MRRTQCPICETERADREVYPATFIPEDLTPAVFSARRVPDRLHYRMVRCGQCGLLRSNPVLPDEDLGRLYARSSFGYAAEAAFARRTYARFLRRASRWSRRRESLMEIGCGNGFFLEEALAQGFSDVHGVEPSSDAIGRAPAHLRGRIRQCLFGDGIFAPGSFDVACAFQVLDHVPDPAAVLRAARAVLRDGGVLLLVNHDSGGLLSRLLGEASPIVDVEHTVLFDQRTIRRILEKCGFDVREVFAVRNTYPIHYWTRLAPIPEAVKSRLVPLLERSRLGQVPVTLSAGNLGAIATRRS